MIQIDKVLTNSNIVILASGSIFLPYILSGIILTALAIYVTTNTRTRALIFVHKGSKALLLFSAFNFIVSSIYRNWIGIAVGIGILLAFMLGLFIRSVMTNILFEKYYQ